MTRAQFGPILLASSLVLSGSWVVNKFHWPDDELKPRLEKLETRVTELEKILFMTSSMSLFEAERRLDDARWNLRESKQLLMQGMITQHQFQLEQLSVRQLERELEFAKSPAGQQIAISELEIIAAERRLAQAQYQLHGTEQIAGRGYGSNKQVERDREFVDIATRNLEAAKAKLEATRRLQAIERPNDK
jgi:multidrug resistance efflux pump